MLLLTHTVLIKVRDVDETQYMCSLTLSITFVSPLYNESSWKILFIHVNLIKPRYMQIYFPVYDFVTKNTICPCRAPCVWH